ncbi:MAG: amidohydrolase family protein [Acidimicrobiales bacterium]
MNPDKLGPCSNGEFVPQAASPLMREARRRAAAAAERQARRLGLSRRAFLRSSMGTATTLLALAACSRDERESSGGGEPGGTFDVPPDATTDTTAADGAVGPGDGEVIVDVQTHFLDPDTTGFGAGFPQASCDADARECFTIDRWADLVLAGSDTSVAVLSALPIVADDHPMSAAKMDEARRVAEALCGDGRVLLQGEAFPAVGSLPEALDRMSALAAEHTLSAWKVYTGVGGRWTLVDEIGDAFLGRVSSLAEEGVGPRIVAAHKGLGIDPTDVGPAAAAHPDLTFVAYHSGYESGRREGPFDDQGGGVDRLIVSCRDAGVGTGGNVYAELGTTWRSVMTSPDEAAHVLGKLLVAFGPDNVLWGTDSIWYGSPQDQIDAFRAFEISPALQEAHGYPALTAEVKRAILGRNAARLHGLDVAGLSPCRFNPEEREAAREEAFARTPDRLYGPVSRRDVVVTWLTEHPWLSRR